MSKLTLGQLTGHIREHCRVTGEAPVGQDEKYFIAEFWELDAGLGQVMDELCSAEVADMATKYIKDALSGPAMRHKSALQLGLLLIGIAEDHARREYDNLIDEYLATDADYGQDVPEVESISLDRSAL